MEVKTRSEEFLFTTIRLEGQEKSGESIVGTCFFFALNRNGVHLQYLVTNKHVVKDLQSGNFSIILQDNGQPVLGHRVNVKLSQDFHQWWTFHPDYDLAIAPLKWLIDRLSQNSLNIYYKTFDESLIPKQEDLQQIDALEEVIFIGYPSGLWDSSNHLPIFRRGITATPFYIDYKNLKVFLIDASVFPGSSGSPVVLYDITGMFLNKSTGAVQAGSRTYFLGLISDGFFEEENWDIKKIPARKAHKQIVQTEQMIDLGLVIKSQVIVEFIDELLKSGVFKNPQLGS